MATLERAIVVGAENWPVVIDCPADSIESGFSLIEGQRFRFYRWPDDEFGIPKDTLFLLSPLQDPTSGYGIRNMQLALVAALA